MTGVDIGTSTVLTEYLKNEQKLTKFVRNASMGTETSTVLTEYTSSINRNIQISDGIHNSSHGMRGVGIETSTVLTEYLESEQKLPKFVRNASMETDTSTVLLGNALKRMRNFDSSVLINNTICVN